jgi:hypothetical protein
VFKAAEPARPVRREFGGVFGEGMSTDPVRNTASNAPPAPDRAGPGAIVYRITLLLLLGACVWFLSRSPDRPQVPAIKPALALPGNTWRRGYEFDKQQRTAQMEFRTDGSIAQAGSGQGKFEIISPNEITLDPTSPTGGLFGWPDGGKKDSWSVEAVGEDLVLQRKSVPDDRVVLHKLREPDEQTKEILRALGDIRTELQLQGNARRSENASIQREVQLLREAEKKRVEEGK